MGPNIYVGNERDTEPIAIDGTHGGNTDLWHHTTTDVTGVGSAIDSHGRGHFEPNEEPKSLVRCQSLRCVKSDIRRIFKGGQCIMTSPAHR